MGKSKGFKGRKKGSDRKQGGQGERANYETIPSENAKYEAYYRESGLIPEEEWSEFWGTLKRTLPTTFRFTGSKAHALSVLKTLQETYIPHLSGITWDDQPVAPPTPLPWYPDNLAWTLTVGKSTIRRCPPFRQFQNFLVAETTIGNISRQEAVSMIPPLLLDVEPHHTVLDMCAAPGSKTAQLIEAIHAGEEAKIEATAKEDAKADLDDDGELGGRPTGLVIANDADYRRSHMLIHQTKRLNSPNLIVTNHDATYFPSLLISPPGAERKEYMKFDRILADVPCTGDGTARKNYGVWRDWTPGGALGLHLTQMRILVRGLQMLKVGGRIVYSTCSMNPIENEAVVAAAIDRCGGLDKVNIVDCSHRLPELKRRPGVKGGWRVMDRDHKWYNTWEEVIHEDSGREARMSRLTKSMFPTEDGKSDEDPTRIPLERCIRVYPHLQDTGGFFIVVLEKKEEIRAIKPEEGGRKKLAAAVRAAEAEKANAEGEGEDEDQIEEVTLRTSTTPAPSSPTKRKLDEPLAPATPPVAKKLKTAVEDEEMPEIVEPVEEPAPKVDQPKGRKKGGSPIEEPFKYLPPHHPVLEIIYNFYNLSPRFPKTCFMVRNAEAIPSRAIYFTSQLAKRILESNEGKNVKFVHCGVKAFMKQDVQEPGVCEWRIQNEGLGIVEAWIGNERVVTARKRSTVNGLLKELFPKVNGEGMEGEVIGEIEERVREMGMGCCVLRVERGEGEEHFQERMVLPLWKSRHSCNLMLPKDERKAMLMRLFNDSDDIKDSTNKNRKPRDLNVNAAASPDLDLPDVDEDAKEADAQDEDDVPATAPETAPVNVGDDVPSAKIPEEEEVEVAAVTGAVKEEVGAL
ncbi:tRNA (cytosine-5-)-methyltransferase ncl1 [Rhizina undulata]